MSTLSELYITMENLRKLNLPIDERLKLEAAKLEEDLIRTEILPTLTEKIEPVKSTIDTTGLQISIHPNFMTFENES